MEAFINKIIPCSFVDGPGCRTAIFMQGCNMRCVYCHNPETQFLCNDCGLCVEGCPSAALVLREGKVSFDEKKCIDCQRCTVICPHHSSPRVRRYSPGDLLSLIEKDQDFIEGVTFSGGECTLNPEFIVAFASLLHQKTKLSVFLDTNGLMPTPISEELIACSEGLMFDLKAFSPEIHLQLTGTDNSLIKHNIGLAARAGKLYEVRFMLMDGINESEAEIKAYFNYIAGLPGKTRLKLMPFSPFGVRGAYQDTPAYPRDKYNAISALGQGILKDRLIKVCYN